jgi:hypothetical protein
VPGTWSRGGRLAIAASDDHIDQFLRLQGEQLETSHRARQVGGVTVKLRTTLQALTRAIIEEADRNPEFAQRLESCLGISERPTTQTDYKPRGSGNRRTPALLDPIDVARQGEGALRQKLARSA